MTGCGIARASSCNVSLYTVCVLLSATGIARTNDLDNFNIEIYVTVDEQKPGTVYSRGSVETGSYYNNLHMTWNMQTRDPGRYELVLYPTYMDLEECCDRVVLTELNIHWTVFSETVRNATFVPGNVTSYTGPQQTPRDQGTLHQLMQLPTFLSPSGYATVLFHTDSSVAYDGFAIRYFAKARTMVLPRSYATIQAFPELKQLAIQPNMQEFTIEATEGFQIWLQIVHVNSSLTGLDMISGSECKFQNERLEIYDSFCSLEDCLLLAFCRSQYSMTTTTVITHGHSAVVRFMCDRPAWTDCAVINFRQISEPDVDSGCPINPGGYREIENSWYLGHVIPESASSRAVNMSWWVQNMNLKGEMTFSVVTNEMLRSQNCLMERLELYSGRCPSESTMITYFCGGVKDTYKMSHSRFAMIRFISRPSTITYERRPFVLWIQAGNSHITDTSPDEPIDPTDVSSETPVSSVLIVVGVATLVTLVAVYARYKNVKRKMSKPPTPATQRRPPVSQPTTPVTQSRPPMTQPPTPVTQSRPPMTNPVPPPHMPLHANTYAGTTFAGGGVSGPGINNPPLRQYQIHPQIHPQPYPGAAYPVPLEPSAPPLSPTPGEYGHRPPMAHSAVTYYPTRT